VLGLSEVGVQDAHAAHEHRHFGCSQGQQLRLVNQQFLGPYGITGLLVVAEAVRLRLKHGDGDHIGLLCEPSIRPGAKEPYLVTSILRSLLDARATGQNDQVSQRDLLPPEAALLNVLWMPSRVFSTLASWEGWLTSQSFWGARRMRAPFGTTALVGATDVDADAQAVETSSETDRPEARTLPLREAMSCSSINL